jgi:hypothetical protein
MAKKRDKVSDEAAIQRATEVLGDERIAELQALSPEDRKAFLQALRFLVASPQDQPKNRGGRPPGSGKMNLAPAFRRMAELQEADPALDDRPAARRVSEEMENARLHVSHETLRKEYRKVKARLREEVREQKRPRYRVVGSVAASYMEPGSLAMAAEEAKRAVLGPDVDALKAVLIGPTMADLAAAVAGPLSVRDYTTERALAAMSVGASREAAEESIRRMRESAAQDALRGLEMLLGKKPLG